MLIAVDIGNSSITIGYFSDEGLLVQKVATHPKRTEKEYTDLLDDFLYQNHMEKEDIGVIISSVVPGHTGVVAKAFERLSGLRKEGVVLANNGMRSGITLSIEVPDELGTDRLADAAGAHELYEGPVAVLDFGTATTVTVVDGDARCIGGAIMPGLGLMSDSLERGTSKLKKIALGPPVSALGRNTEGNIRSGIFLGTAGAVERLLSEIETETGLSFKVVVTGGYGEFMTKLIRRSHHLNPHLTLEGLRILYEKNRLA